MTRDATTRDGRVIHKCNNGPICGDVAVRTFARCQYVTGRLGRCPYEPAVGVTAGAGRVGWTEGGTDMTALAGDVGMCAVKNEASAEMIK